MKMVKNYSEILSGMRVGDSFVGPDEDYVSIRNAAASYGKRHGQTYTVRRIPEPLRGGNAVRDPNTMRYRIWCWRLS